MRSIIKANNEFERKMARLKHSMGDIRMADEKHEKLKQLAIRTGIETRYSAIEVLQVMINCVNIKKMGFEDLIKHIQERYMVGKREEVDAILNNILSYS